MFTNCYVQTSVQTLQNLCSSHLSHYHILAFLDEFPLCLDDGLQELDVLHVPAVRLDAVDEVLHHALVDLAAELEVVHENVLHCHCFQDLEGGEEREQKVRKSTSHHIPTEVRVKPTLLQAQGGMELC